jgi:hypothetical protein
MVFEATYIDEKEVSEPLPCTVSQTEDCKHKAWWTRQLVAPGMPPKKDSLQVLFVAKR